MAKIVEVTNPVTGQPAQVDQLDHTAQQIDDGLNIARGVSNPNLLDNWYFGNPVNQRNVSGTIDAVGYFLDRWELVSGSVTIGSNGITLNGTIVQILETAVGTDATASALTTEGVVVASYDNSSKTISLTGTGQTFVAVKLELGSQQTLAHQDADGNWVPNEIPDYGEQLTRCQRYVRPGPTSVIVSGPTRGNYYASSPGDFPQMRDIPVSLANLVGLEVNDITGRTTGVTINTVYKFTNQGGITIRLSGDPGTAYITIPTEYLISCDL